MKGFKCLIVILSCLNVSANKNLSKNQELLKSIREKPGSVLIIQSPFSKVVDSKYPDVTGIRAVRFDGELIHRYFEVGKIFISETNSPQRYSDSREHFPANITAAITGPDKELYLFRGDKFCKRPLLTKNNTDCPQWYENRQLFGCNSDSIKNLDICLNPTIDGIISERKDKSGTTKFVIKGKVRLKLIINADLVTGHLVSIHGHPHILHPIYPGQIIYPVPSGKLLAKGNEVVPSHTTNGPVVPLTSMFIGQLHTTRTLPQVQSNVERKSTMGLQSIVNTTTKPYSSRTPALSTQVQNTTATVTTVPIMASTTPSPSAVTLHLSQMNTNIATTAVPQSTGSTTASTFSTKVNAGISNTILAYSSTEVTSTFTITKPKGVPQELQSVSHFMPTPYTSLPLIKTSVISQTLSNISKSGEPQTTSGSTFVTETNKRQFVPALTSPAIVGNSKLKNATLEFTPSITVTAPTATVVTPNATQTTVPGSQLVLNNSLVRSPFSTVPSDSLTTIETSAGPPVITRVQLNNIATQSAITPSVPLSQPATLAANIALKEIILPKTESNSPSIRDVTVSPMPSQISSMTPTTEFKQSNLLSTSVDSLQTGKLTSPETPLPIRIALSTTEAMLSSQPKLLVTSESSPITLLPPATFGTQVNAGIPTSMSTSSPLTSPQTVSNLEIRNLTVQELALPTTTSTKAVQLHNISVPLVTISFTSLSSAEALKVTQTMGSTSVPIIEIETNASISTPLSTPSTFAFSEIATNSKPQNMTVQQSALPITGAAMVTVNPSTVVPQDLQSISLTSATLPASIVSSNSSLSVEVKSQGHSNISSTREPQPTSSTLWPTFRAEAKERVSPSLTTVTSTVVTVGQLNGTSQELQSVWPPVTKVIVPIVLSNSTSSVDSLFWSNLTQPTSTVITLPTTATPASILTTITTSTNPSIETASTYTEKKLKEASLELQNFTRSLSTTPSTSITPFTLPSIMETSVIAPNISGPRDQHTTTSDSLPSTNLTQPNSTAITLSTTEAMLSVKPNTEVTPGPSFITLPLTFGNEFNSMPTPVSTSSPLVSSQISPEQKNLGAKQFASFNATPSIGDILNGSTLVAVTQPIGTSQQFQSVSLPVTIASIPILALVSSEATPSVMSQISSNISTTREPQSTGSNSWPTVITETKTDVSSVPTSVTLTLSQTSANSELKKTNVQELSPSSKSTVSTVTVSQFTGAPLELKSVSSPIIHMNSMSTTAPTLLSSTPIVITSREYQETRSTAGPFVTESNAGVSVSTLAIPTSSQIIGSEQKNVSLAEVTSSTTETPTKVTVTTMATVPSIPQNIVPESSATNNLLIRTTTTLLPASPIITG